MKKHIWLFVLFAITIVNAQEKTQKAKDTIKTEVVKIVTSYVPKISDAFKLKQQPTISHTKETEKKKLSYEIFSVPVASTFVPKSGSLKKIDLGKRERLYDNYISAGFGNIMTPFIEGYFRRSMSHYSELGGHAKFLLSSDPVQDTKLSSTFYNLNFDLYHQQIERYLTWEAGLSLERNKYNWYGLPSNIPYTEFVIDAIEPGQTYGFYKLFGVVDFDDSNIDKLKGDISFFSDGLSSNEFAVNLGGNFRFPLENLRHNLNDLHVNTSLEYLGGKFQNSYEAPTNVKHRFFTVMANPYYNFYLKDFYIKLGAKANFALDMENNFNHLLLYPDIEISYPIVRDYTNIYVGATGNLETNSFQRFSNQNPYVSPTLYVTQTNERYNVFGGFKGTLSKQFTYNLKGSYSDIEDQPFFSLNYSKSNGLKSTGDNGFFLYGYEFGNSFRVLYDDIKKVTFFGEVTFDGIKNLTLGANITYNNFTLTNRLHPWNMPQINGEISGLYKVDKWYFGTNVFFVGQRKGVQYQGTSTAPFDVIDLDSYLDVNFNGGYHFGDDFSVFLNVNNALNNIYQRYTNFNVQGLQVMGGFTWKFDSFF